MASGGFPRRVRFIPVPSPVFGPLLEQIDDLAEFKCTLRVIWLLHQKKGYPRFVTIKEVLADRTLAKALAGGGPSREAEVKRALARSVERGTLVTGAVEEGKDQEQVYMLNTESDRKALTSMVSGRVSAGPMPKAEPWEGAIERPNIFALYEDNIGMLSPMIAEELREAEQLYPADWIEDAFREAVGHNKRSWRYIARILERWEQEGRSDGDSGGYSKKTSHYKEYFRR